MTEVDGVCRWCGKPFRSGRRGSPQHFCSSQHRAAFHSAARRFAEQAVAAGTLTIEAIKSGDPAACTLPVGRVSPAPPPEQGGTATTRSLGDVLDRIFETLSEVELDRLPKCIWALIFAVNDMCLAVSEE
jgi:hypothetical protein